MKQLIQSVLLFTALHVHAQCFSISPQSVSLPSRASTGMVTVASSSGCQWTAASLESWVSIVSGSSGAGNGSIAYAVTNNANLSPRTGTIIAAGQFFTITQSGDNPTNNPGTFQWISATPSTNAVYPNGLRCDWAGNAILAGQFYTLANFGGTNGTNISSAGSADGFVSKFNSTGNIIWARSIGGHSIDNVAAVAIDSSDNIIVAGEFYGVIDVGNGITLSANGTSSDVFVAKYAPGSQGVPGSCLWARSYGSPASDTASATAVDTSGNVFVASTSGGTINFGNGIMITAAGSYDITLVKYAAADGATLWARFYGGVGFDQPFGLAVDSAGSLLVTGLFSAGGTLGGGAVTNGGLFVAKYANSDGSYQWARTPGPGKGKAIAVNPGTGNILVTGNATSTANFGGGTSSSGIFIVSYDSNGTYQWDLRTGGSADEGSAIAVDAGSYLALTGRALGALNFGGGFLSGNGNPNYYVATFTLSGNSRPVYRWAKRATGSGASTFGTGIAFDGFGRVLASVLVQGTADLGGATVTGSQVSGAAAIIGYSR